MLRILSLLGSLKIFRCLSHVNEEGRTVMTVCLFLFSICSVVLMNQKFSFVFNYIVVFIEMAVLVQAGNFSCISS